MNLRHSLYIYMPLVLVALFQNLIHEGLHFVLARLMGVGVQEFRFLTNGLLTSQVIYAVPSEARTGAHWLLIALGPTVITTLMGYVVYLLRGRLITRWPAINLTVWYLGALFITIDPIYIGVMSWFMQRTDVDVMDVAGWPAWPVRIVLLIAAALGTWLVVRWRSEARQNVERYALTSAHA